MIQERGRIGQYEVITLLGRGGMGSVYKARDPRFDRIVAIKRLHEQFADDPETVARFKSEAVIQAKLNHPNIATVFDFVADEGTLAIVMEFVDGETLAAAIERTAGKGMPAERAAAIMGQILDAVAVAHEHGLVHRDLKPSNLMLRLHRGREIAKVMDFGVAKILGSTMGKTRTRATIGTLEYMSPEHIRSPKHVDVRSDLYSLGIVLYEMLTGATPFDADSEYDLQQQILTRPVRSTSIAGPLGPVIERATAADPAGRYQSAEEMLEALETGAGGAAGQQRVVPDLAVGVPSEPTGTANLAAQPVPETPPSSVATVWRAPVGDAVGSRKRIPAVMVATAVAVIVVVALIITLGGEKEEVATTGTTDTTKTEAATVETVTTNGWPPPLLASATPIVLSPQSRDYGVIRKGARVMRQFEIANQSDEPITIQLARSACRCLYFEYVGQIPAKGRVSAAITIDGARAPSGELRESITVSSPTNASVRGNLEILAHVEALPLR